ncbi:MAG: fabG [Candidatus Midichloriaceae bacterium]|jgi:3-oxoacyl-[acyl-carrier protein] reductase|nr:fabG [Candidatus Midichloriaceae bacterium]
MFDLTGKVALITGATGGIGHMIATKMHEQGATVVISGTRTQLLDVLAAELKERVYVIPSNLKDPVATKELFAKAESVAGQVDILVCNAGITRDNLMIRMSDEEFDDVISVNLKSAFILSREALKAMSKRRSGRIIGISSVVGRSGNFGQTNYAASKAGLIGMIKSVALEGSSRGVTANCIAPGFITSPMTDAIKDEVKEKIKAKIPVGFFGEPNDIAATAVFLASNEARYITGAVIDVNGGMYM